MPRRTTASAEPPADETPAETPADGAADQAASAPPPPLTPPAAESGFFTWLRDLGVPRRAGWLGGVCAGVAERIGIDPLIVRGIAVVLAVVGAPVALVYAVAWFLLPDEQGVIHAQELGHGRVTRALPGIVAVFLLSFLPLTQGFWYTGALYWSNLDWGGAIGRVVWTGVMLVAVIVLVVWLARRASAEVPTIPATTDDRPDTVPTFPDAAAEPDADGAPAVVAVSVVAASAAPLTAPGEPPAPPVDASAEELADWKRSQDEWQQQRAAWAAEQKRSERERRQAEAGVRAVAAMEAARERVRIRKLTRPRASAGVVFLVLGLGLVAAAIAAFAASKAPATQGAEWLIGAATLVFVLGVGTVIVALARRRSGALAFFSILSVLVLAVAVLVPTDRVLLPLGVSYGIDGSHDGRYAQLAGNTSVYVPDRDLASAPVVDLWQYAGGVEVHLEEGATVRVELTTDSAELGVTVQEQLPEGQRYAWYHVRDGRLELTVGSGEPDLELHLWLGRSAWLYISIPADPLVPVPLDPAPDERNQMDVTGEPVPVPTPVPTDTTTPGAL
jgi:phage shock protein PspC (stress-responsive transcriptional regulator)/FtsH-binding integral membrane protein